MLLALLFDYLPHYPYDSRTRYHDTRIYPGRTLNALLLGQNYHLIHHLWTTIPWYRYRSVLRSIREDLAARASGGRRNRRRSRRHAVQVESTPEVRLLVERRELIEKVVEPIGIEPTTS